MTKFSELLEQNRLLVLTDQRQIRAHSADIVRQTVYIDVNGEGRRPPGLYVAILPEDYDERRHDLIGGPTCQFSLVVVAPHEDGRLFLCAEGGVAYEIDIDQVDLKEFDLGIIDKSPIVGKPATFVTIAKDDPDNVKYILAIQLSADHGTTFIHIPRGTNPTPDTIALTGSPQMCNRKRTFLV